MTSLKSVVACSGPALGALNSTGDHHPKPALQKTSWSLCRWTGLKLTSVHQLKLLNSLTEVVSTVDPGHANRRAWQSTQKRLAEKRSRQVCRASDGDGGGRGSSSSKDAIQLYGKIERVFEETARRSQGTDGLSGDWEEIEGAWVLPPKEGPAKALVHFIGGAFVGASPQLTYRLFLETLAKRGVLVVATPYPCGFDHLRIADEAQFKFDRCTRALRSRLPEIDELPCFGVGHSMGALTHLLIGARYAVQRQGNALLSFNNKSAATAIPIFSPAIAPMAQNLGPLIAQLTGNPALRMGTEMALKQLQALSPPVVKQLLPLIEQLPPLYQDLVDGKDEFTPAPDETRRLVRAYYGVGRNLLVKFENDTIDETSELAAVLSEGAACTPFLDLKVRTLSGDHARPLQQAVPDLPPEVASAVSRGSEFLYTFAAGSPFAELAKGLGDAVGATQQAQRYQQIALADIELLVDELTAWMELGVGSGSRRGVYLPS